MYVLENRVLESSTSTGVGAFALTAVVGYRRFSSRRAVGDTCEYLIEAVDAVGRPTGDYEYGLGTYSAVDTLTRTAVIGSSNADALVNFAAGPKRVLVPMLAPITDAMRFRWQEAIGLYVAGDIVLTASDTPPTGTVKCNQAALSRTTYARLFARIGTIWGAGDGATTFNVPELRGEFFRGLDDGRGVDTARVLATAQGDAIRNIVGSAGTVYRAAALGHSGALAIAAYGSSPAKGGVIGSDAGDNVTFNFDASRVVPTAAENRPRNVALLACIRY